MKDYNVSTQEWEAIKEALRNNGAIPNKQMIYELLEEMDKSFTKLALVNLQKQSKKDAEIHQKRLEEEMEGLLYLTQKYSEPYGGDYLMFPGLGSKISRKLKQALRQPR